MLAHMLRAGPTACCTAKLSLRLQGKLSSSASGEADTSQPLLLLLLLLITMLLTVHVPSCRKKMHSATRIAGREDNNNARDGLAAVGGPPGCSLSHIKNVILSSCRVQTLQS
jgi:hypothetical protein